MNTAVQTWVKTADTVEWSPMPEHVSLFHREIVSAVEEDAPRNRFFETIRVPVPPERPAAEGNG